MAESTPTPTNVMRQPSRSPTSAPSGTPTAIAAVSPPLTTAIARPRCSGGTSAPRECVGVRREEASCEGEEYAGCRESQETVRLRRGHVEHREQRHRPE